MKGTVLIREEEDERDCCGGETVRMMSRKVPSNLKKEVKRGILTLRGGEKSHNQERDVKVGEGASFLRTRLKR